MKTNSISRSMPGSKLLFAGLLLAGSAASILLSPKWAVPVMAWIAPALLLFYFRHATIRFKILWFMMATIAAQVIASSDVAPFPLPVLAIVSIITTLKMLVVFLIDRWVAKRTNRFVTTLIFPALYVAKEFTDILFNGGAWWSIANTQYSFSWLAQFSSVTGILGISFIIYWFAAVVVWCFEKYFRNEKFVKGVMIYAGVFSTVMLFGALRFYSNEFSNKPSVKIAGVTALNLGVMQAIYKDVTGDTISVDLKSSLSSPQLQKVNAALVPFIENPDTAKFINGYKAIYRLQDSLFALSQKAADKGAKIIVWSEANAIMPQALQPDFIRRGKDFTAKNKVYLLMAIAAFEPGKITPTRNFLENKTVFVGPGGDILNVFHKNHPVPFAEHSTPGDGKIPVIETPYGKISPSICYDADLPLDMEQLAKNKSDALLLPSGDWYAIAPYHSYMAMFRGIENGNAVVRQASGGLSLVTDYRGKIQTSFDFYQPGEKFWITDVTIGHVNTVYGVIGDAFAYLCVFATIIIILWIPIIWIRKKILRKKELAVMQMA